MIKHDLSRYEEFIIKHNINLEYNYQNKKEEVYIIDETGLKLDETLGFDILKRLKIVDIKYYSFDKIEIVLDCEKSPCGIKYIKLIFEDIMHYNGDYIYSGSIDFIYLKEGFRLEIKEKKKNRNNKSVNFYEVEAKFLTIKRIEEIDLSHNKELKYKSKIVENNELARTLEEKWKLSNEQFYEIYKSNDRYNTYIEDGLNQLNLSKDLSYFLYNMHIIHCSVLDYGKTYNHDEFYLRLDVDNSMYVEDNQGNIKYNDKLIQIKFIKVLSLEVDGIVRGNINCWYNKGYYDNSYQLGLCVDGKIMTIRAKDIIIEVLV